jgi:hypothetical protein
MHLLYHRPLQPQQLLDHLTILPRLRLLGRLALATGLRLDHARALGDLGGFHAMLP